MATAGRAVVFSGATVAIGLALLLFMPLPFMVSMGVGGFLIPLVSIVAAVTLQPVLLSLFGRRGTRRVHVADFLRDRLRLPVPRFAGTTDVERGLWARLARSIMRRPLVYLALGVTVLVAAAVPAFDLELTPGSASGTPQSPESIRGFNVLREAVGPGALAPTQVLVDAGEGRSVRDPAVASGIDRLIANVRADPEVARVDFEPEAPYVDGTSRFAYVSIAGKHEYGELAAQDCREIAELGVRGQASGTNDLARDINRNLDLFALFFVNFDDLAIGLGELGWRHRPGIVHERLHSVFADVLSCGRYRKSGQQCASYATAHQL